MRATVAALAATLTTAAAAVDAATYVAMSATVVQVEAVRDGGPVSMGSGVVVAAQRVVTNCHVTRDATSIAVSRGGDRLPVRAQAADIDRDLCMLEVPALALRPAPLGRASELRVGDPVIALGYTGGFGLRRSPGQVTGLHRLGDAPVVQTSNRFNSGASGGGLFDDQGRLVGILTFRLRGAEGHYYAAPVEWLAFALDSQAPFGAVSPLRTDRLPYWQRPDDGQPAFLRAASLLQRERWSELHALAAAWSKQAADDATPWYTLALADEALGRAPQALAAYGRAVALEPRHAQAWWKLGMLSARLGFAGRAEQALRALEPLNAELAQQLAAQLGITR